MKDFIGKKQTRKQSIIEANYWVSIYDLPYMARNTFMGDWIYNVLEKIVEVDLDEDIMEWGEYMRV